jgi:competence transcription factor ComK
MTGLNNLFFRAGKVLIRADNIKSFWFLKNSKTKVKLKNGTSFYTYASRRNIEARIRNKILT